METFIEWLTRLKLLETYYGVSANQYNRLFDDELENVIQRVSDPAPHAIKPKSGDKIHCSPTKYHVDFKDFILILERTLVDPGVVQSYEREFQRQLDALIQRTTDPALRNTFASMKSFSFTNYIVGSLFHHGCIHRYDPEEALQFIAMNMLSPVGERGQPRKTLFDIDTTYSWNLQQGNPLAARFKLYLRHDLAAICGGKIPRLAYVQRRPGMVSISAGRERDDEEPGSVSADQIPDRASGDWTELVTDIISLLRRQEKEHPELPLVSLFTSILSGEQTRSTRSIFGRRESDLGRQHIISAIEQYASATENRRLLRLLDRFKDFDPTRANPAAARTSHQPVRPKPQQIPLDERDYRSIIEVMEKHGQRANLAILGKARRRWLERPPRDPSSPHPNRLADVLARMVADGVLQERRTRAGGRLFVPGRRYGEFAAAVPVS
jgi:hypothetical protein